MSEYPPLPSFKRSNRIKELRQEKNLTLKELGDALGLRDNTLSQYETGKRTPKEEILEQIADYFDVSVRYLAGFSTERDNFGDELLRSIRRFDFENATPEKNRQFFLDVAYILIEQIEYMQSEIEEIKTDSYDPYG